MRINCLKCEYLSKRPGIGPYFIWRCNFWGLISKQILPQNIVRESIGRDCPFFKEKIVKRKESLSIDDNESGLNIIV